MIALDTNALVRLLIVDDGAQCQAVRRLASQQRIRLLRTVLLEAEWLLRGRFKLERSLILAFFAGLADTENVVIEDEAAVHRALGACGQGLDFADAMHSALAGDTPLHSFDEKFVKRASRLGGQVKLIKLR